MESNSYYVCTLCGSQINNPILSNSTRQILCLSCFHKLFDPYIIVKCPQCSYQMTLLKCDLPSCGIPLCKHDGTQMLEVGK